MLDRVHARADRRLDAVGPVGVRRDAFAEAVSLLHDRLHLGEGELGLVLQVVPSPAPSVAMILITSAPYLTS